MEDGERLHPLPSCLVRWGALPPAALPPFKIALFPASFFCVVPLVPTPRHSRPAQFDCKENQGAAAREEKLAGRSRSYKKNPATDVTWRLRLPESWREARDWTSGANSSQARASQKNNWKLPFKEKKKNERRLK